MDEPGRPRPGRRGRPELRIAPPPDSSADERPHLVDAAAAVWLAAAATLVIAVAGTALHHVAVHEALSDSFAADHPAIDRNDIAETVDFIMIGNAAVELLILAVAVIGIVRVRERLTSGRTTMAVVAALAVAVEIQFWLVSEPAHQIVGGIIAILPLVMAGFAVIGSALLYAPTVGAWLNAPIVSAHFKAPPP